MITLAKHGDEKIIDSYISNEYSKCLYLYLDYKKYGLNDENINVYFHKNNEKILGIILKYYNTLHIYSRDKDLNYDEISEFVLKNNPTMVCAEKEIIKNLQQKFNETEFYVEYGYVRSISSIDDIETINLTEATEEDFDEITKLLMTDEGLGGSQTYESLKQQLLERYRQKFCRNFILRDNDKIIAHVCTGAENDKIVILTDLIVDKEYRNRGLGKKVCENFCKKIISDGQEVFLINYTETSSKLYEKVGFTIRCEWGKLYKKVK